MKVELHLAKDGRYVVMGLLVGRKGFARSVTLGACHDPSLGHRRWENPDYTYLKSQTFPGVYSFSALLLRHFSDRGEERLSHGKPSRTLYELAIRPPVRGSVWLHKLLGRDTEVNPDWEGGPSHRPGNDHRRQITLMSTGYFRPSGDRIALGPEWKGSRLRVFEHAAPNSAQEREVEPSRFLDIACNLEDAIVGNATKPHTEPSLDQTAEGLLERILATKGPLNEKTRLSITFPNHEAIKSPEALAALRQFIVFGDVRLVDCREGCVELVIDLRREDAERLLAAWRTGELAHLGVAQVRTSGEVGAVSRFAPRPVDVRSGAGDDAEEVKRFFKVAGRIEAVRRPLRRLRWLLSPSIARSPIAHTLAESDTRFFCAENVGENWAAMRRDWAACLVFWPCITALLILISCGLVAVAGVPVSMGMGLLTGLALSVAGAQVCSSVVSPLACGAAGILLGWAFGFSHAVLHGAFAGGGMLSAASVLANPFIAVNGGIVGLTATQWRSVFPGAVIAVMLLSTGISIAAAAWMMARPAGLQSPQWIAAMTADVWHSSRFLRGVQTLYATRFQSLFAGLSRAGAASTSTSWKPPHGLRGLTFAEVCATAMGTMAGLGIPLVLGLTALLQREGVAPPVAFSAAFCAIGGAAFAVSIRLRTSRWSRVLAFALVHAGLAATLFSFAFGYAGTTLGLVALAGSTAWFHATWYTCAFAIARHLGSPRAAAFSAAIEGGVGYVIFILIRLVWIR